MNCGKCLNTGLIYYPDPLKVDGFRQRFCGCAAGVANEIHDRTGQAPGRQAMKQCEGSLTNEICYTEIPDGARWCDPCAMDLHDDEPEMPAMGDPYWGKLQADLDAEFPVEGRKFNKAMADMLKRAKDMNGEEK